MIKLHRVKAFLLRHIYEIMASIDRKVDIFYWPAIDLLTFGLLTVYINQLDIRAGLAGVIIGGLIFWTLVYNIQRDIAVTLLEDAWNRNLFNLFSSPLKISEVLVGSLILATSKAVVTIAFVTALAFGIFHFNLFELGPTVFFYAFNIFCFGWAFGFLTASLILRFGTRVQTVAWSLIALIYPISGVFYPLSVLPGFLAEFAKAIPTSYIFEEIRAMLLSGQKPSLEGLLVIVFLNLIYLSAGIYLFIQGFKHAKRRGWFIHPT